MKKSANSLLPVCSMPICTQAKGTTRENIEAYLKYDFFKIFCDLKTYSLFSLQKKEVDFLRKARSSLEPSAEQVFFVI